MKHLAFISTLLLAISCDSIPESVEYNPQDSLSVDSVVVDTIQPHKDTIIAILDSAGIDTIIRK